MLKKILSIFFILCLVFSLTVTCFAQLDLSDKFSDPEDVYIPHRSVFSYPDYILTLDIRGIYDVQTTGWFTVAQFNNLVIGHKYFVRMKSDPAQTATSGNYFQFYSSYSTRGLGIISNGTLDNRFENGYTVTCNDSRAYFDSARYNGNNVPVKFYIQIIDLTVTFPDQDLSATEVNDILTFFNVPWSDLGVHTYINPSLSFDPFLDFYGNVFGHTFDYFGSLGSTYSFPFALIAGVLAILVFIFLVVFMIKRFTGGKT